MQSPSAVILEPRKIKADTVSTVSPSISHEVMKVKSESEVAQSCPTLRDPMDCSLPGSSAHGIFQARVLEWAAVSFSRGSSPPRDRICISNISCAGRQILLLLSHLGSPHPREVRAFFSCLTQCRFNFICSDFGAPKNKG